MSGAEKAEVLDKVASSGLPKRRALGELGVPRSTYYRWLRRKEQQGLEDDVGGGKPPWNTLTTKEVDSVLSAAREMPDMRGRFSPIAEIGELAARFEFNPDRPSPPPRLRQAAHWDALGRPPERTMDCATYRTSEKEVQ